VKFKDDNPLTDHYGRMVRPRMTREQAGKASFEERFDAIARYVVSHVKTFFFALSPEGKISYELDDIVTEVWVELAQKNHLYRPELGNYLAWANTLIRNLLIDLRERSRCIRMPTNASTVFRRSEVQQEAGTLPEARRLLLLQMMAAGRDHFLIRSGPDGEDEEGPSPSDSPEQADERALTEDARFYELSAKLNQLSTLECVVLGATLGLWGRTPSTYREVALQYGHDEKFIRLTLRRARRKLGIRVK